MEGIYDIKSIETGLRGIICMMPRGSMNTLSVAIEDSIKRLHEPMQLAIIGKISSSKSTLVNAILGKDEIMSTGQKEVTYNVGWLKYGETNSDIVIHHKDGRPNSVKKNEEFARWTTENHSSEIDNISYIEIFDDAEILKDINIIDTPGLDALRGKDSQNTLDFIKNVRPDAVIMLFTHSVSENVLDIVGQFNTGTSFNPLNAIGILSKIDVLWQEDFERKKSALDIGKRMTSNKLKKDETIRKTLFNLYPISALLFLASSYFDESYLSVIKTMSKSDPDVIRKAMKSVSNFLKEDLDLNITLSQRQKLIEKIGLYGVSIVLDILKHNSEVKPAEIREKFKYESGASDFMKILHNHFGNRAKLIKMESIYQNLQITLTREKNLTKDVLKLQLLSKIQQKISDLFSSLVFEHREYELLYKIYNKEIDLEPEIRSEFINLCGENGVSAPERLGINAYLSTDNLINEVSKRVDFWKKTIALEPDPEERQWMKVVHSSYRRLYQKIKQMTYQLEQAKAFLNCQ